MASYEIDWKPENVFWGYFDPATKPVATVASGDEVLLHALPACDPPDLPPEGKGTILPAHLAAMEAHKADKGAGPHMVTGPVYVEGAMPGDVLQVDILEVETAQDWGFTAIMPLLGALPDEFTDYERLHLAIDKEAGVCRMPWGLELPLEPFFGIMAVAPPSEWGRIGTPEPRAMGGNMDNKELKPGTTLYLPVFQEGALFSAGDGHGRQGDGEVCIAAVETALTGRFRLTVRKDMQLKTPFAENDEYLISMGFDEDLDEAMRKAVRDMIDVVASRANLTRNHAYMLLSIAGDLRITQVVDGEKGVHMMFKKEWLST